MNCKNIQSRLSAYVDRELSGVEMFEMRSHIEGCRACREEEAEFRTLKRLLGGVSAVEPSKDFEERLVHSIFDQREHAPSRRSSFLLATLVAAAAMATTLLVLPSMRSTPTAKQPVKSSSSNDYAFEINRDQLYEASSDPLSGGHLASPAVYGH